MNGLLHKMTMLPQIASPSSHRSYHIDQVIPAGVLSQKMIRNSSNLIRDSSRLSLRQQSRKNSSTLSMRQPQLSQKFMEVKKGFIETKKLKMKPVSKATTKSKRRKKVSLKSKEILNSQIGGDTFSIIKHTSGETISNIGSFISPVRSQKAGAGPPSKIDNNVHNQKIKHSQRKLIKAAPSADGGTNYKVSRYLNKLKKSRETSAENTRKQLTHGKLSLLSLPLIPASRNRIYDEYKSGKIMEHDYSQDNTQFVTKSRKFESQFQYNNNFQEPEFKLENQAYHKRGLSSLGKKQSSPTIDRRKHIQSVVSDGPEVEQFKIKFNELREQNSFEEQTWKRNQESTMVAKDSQGYISAKLDHFQDQEAIHINSRPSTGLIPQQTSKPFQGVLSRCYSQEQPGIMRNVFSAPHGSSYLKTQEPQKGYAYPLRDSGHRSTEMLQNMGRQSSHFLPACHLVDSQKYPHPHQINHRDSAKSSQMSNASKKCLDPLHFPNDHQTFTNRQGFQNVLSQCNTISSQQFMVCQQHYCQQHQPQCICFWQQRQQQPQLLQGCFCAQPYCWQQQPQAHFVTLSHQPQQVLCRDSRGGSVSTMPIQKSNQPNNRQYKETARFQTSDGAQLPILNMMTGTESNMDMTQPIQLSVHVQTLPETRVIETQTDPYQEPEKQPPKLSIQLMDEQTPIESIKKPSQKAEVVQKKIAFEAKENVQNESTKVEDKKVAETVMAPNKANDTTTLSIKPRAANLPPADLVFDHIDRVSAKFNKVKSKLAINEDSMFNASFVSKGSFRQSSQKKRREDGNENKIIKRIGTFDTSQDSDEYIEQLDYYLKSEENQAGVQSVPSKNTDTNQKKNEMIKKMGSFKLEQLKKEDQSKAVTPVIKSTLDHQAINIMLNESLGKKEFCTPEKDSYSNQDEQKNDLLSPIGKTMSQRQIAEDGFSSLKVLSQDHPEESLILQLRLRSSSQEDTAKTPVGIGGSSVQSQNQKISPTKFELQDLDGFKTQPNRNKIGQVQNKHLLKVTDKLRSIQIERLANATDPSAADLFSQSGGINNSSFAHAAISFQNKSILKSKGDKTKSIGLEFDQIDEDSSEEKGVSSGNENQGNKKFQSLIKVAKEVKFENNENSDEEKTDVQMGKALKGIRNSSIRDSLLLPKQEESSHSSWTANKSQMKEGSETEKQQSLQVSQSQDGFKNNSSDNSDNSDNSDDSDDSDDESRDAFIKRMQQERKRIVALSANQVPEIYQYFFQSNEDEEHHPRKSSKDKLDLSDRPQSSARTEFMRSKKKKGTKKKKFDLKRQSTLDVKEMSRQNTLTTNIISILGNKDTPKEAEAQRSFKNHGSTDANNEEPTPQSKRSLNPKFRPIARSMTFEQQDETMRKELKKFATDKGLIKKRKRSRRGSAFSINADSDQSLSSMASGQLKLKRKIGSNNNTTIKELPGMEGGTSHNSPMPSPLSSARSSLKNKSFILIRIQEQLKDATPSCKTQEQTLPIHALKSQSIQEIKNTSDPTDKAPAIGKLVLRKDISMSKEELEKHMLKPFLKKKPALPFLEKTQQSTKNAKKRNSSALNVYTQQPTLIRSSQSMETLGKRNSIPGTNSKKGVVKVIKIKSKKKDSRQDIQQTQSQQVQKEH